MKRLYRRILTWALLLVWLPAGALALTGQSISTLQTYYREDIAYLNELTGRHLLPKDLTALDLNDNDRTQYYYYDDALQVTIAADMTGIIESCEIRLIYPEGAVEGNSLYLDFIAANYHSLAFLMAMHVSNEVSSRFLLVQEIAAALESNYGAYERQLGSYTVSCVKVVGEGAVFTFSNSGLKPAQTEAPLAPEGVEEPEPIDTTDEAHLG